MKYCIAIDGGGSKTEIVLFDETGHILRRHVGPVSYTHLMLILQKSTYGHQALARKGWEQFY